MISLQNYFIEPNYDILIETNIDQLFGIFDKQLGKIDNNKIFDQIIEKLMVQQHIEYYEYESDDSALKNVKGRWGIDPKTKNYYITIEIPKSINQIKLNKQISRNILHELLHVLNDQKIPTFVTKKTNNKSKRFNTRNSVNPNTYNFNNVTDSDLVKYLEYVTHIREKANFAFTIALSCYFDMNNKSPYDIFTDNYEKIKDYYTGQIDTTTFNNYIAEQKLDAIELFSMQYAMFHLGQRRYINQVYSILRLSIKYWKRLNSLLGEPYGN